MGAPPKERILTALQQDPSCLAVSANLLPRALELVRQLVANASAHTLVVNVKGPHPRLLLRLNGAQRTVTISEDQDPTPHLPPPRSSANTGFNRGIRFRRSTRYRTGGSWSRSAAADTPSHTPGRRANAPGSTPAYDESWPKLKPDTAPRRTPH